MGKRVTRSVDSAREGQVTVKSAAKPLVPRRSIVRHVKAKTVRSPPEKATATTKKTVAVKTPTKCAIKLRRCPQPDEVSPPAGGGAPKKTETITKEKTAPEKRKAPSEKSNATTKKTALQVKLRRCSSQDKQSLPLADGAPKKTITKAKTSPEKVANKVTGTRNAPREKDAQVVPLEEQPTPIQKSKFNRLSLRRSTPISLSPKEIIEEVNKSDDEDDTQLPNEMPEEQPKVVEAPVPIKRPRRCSVAITRVKFPQQPKQNDPPEKQLKKDSPHLVQSENPANVSVEPKQTKSPSQEAQQRPRRKVKPLAQVPSRKPNSTSKKLKPADSKQIPRRRQTLSSPTPSQGSDDIYAFPSQSSFSESDDATADVIQKLIKQGKIAFAKNAKPKPRKKPKVKPANWQNIVKNLSVADPNKPKKKVNKKKKENNSPMPLVHDDDHDDDPPMPLVDDDPDDDPPILQTSPIAHHSKHHMSNSNQSFSMLARKVMTKQTERAVSTPIAQKNRKEQLLAIARSFAHSLQSTPIASTSGENNRRSQQPPGSASPWRVENENIPRTFYFSRNKDDLPSYSSDVIASSQSSSRRIVPSDVSLNLSNIENVSPEKTPTQKSSKPRIPLGNANPRHGIPDRSPLKPINVIDVVTLPYRATAAPISTNHPNKTPRLNQSKTIDKENATAMNNQKSIKNDLFGFDDDYDLSDDNGSSPKKQINLPSKKTLRAKLIKLKRLLPPKPTRVSYGTVRSIFKPIEKQKDIRQMLSSTMMEKKSANDTNQKRIEFDDESLDAIPHDEIDDDGDENEASRREVHLFDDYDEPQTSFDKSIKIKTYERPKRKAARKRNNFVLFSNSDSEEEEEEERKAARKKRTKPDRKDNEHKKELNGFIQEFNSMCEEVDQYELVVDKSNKNSSG